jgi:hypothetical protein
MSDKDHFFKTLSRRYGRIDPEALESILCPLLVPIKTLDKTIHKVSGQAHYRASFSLDVGHSNVVLIQKGRTGKFVPASYCHGEPWREVAKGRIIEVDAAQNIAYGEVYTGGPKKDLEKALAELTVHDFLEIDQFGASAKILSGLVEYYLTKHALERGYKVKRMPEDIARHLGAYYHYDFEFEKSGVTKKIEVKSLWGTNTKYARLIHSKGGDYETSSCKFETQDIFAVSLFLRTGNVFDFAFARSVPRDIKQYGLPRSSEYPDYVHQNPVCSVGDGTWFPTVEEVWDLP